MTPLVREARAPVTARIRCRMPLLMHKRFLVVDPSGRLVELEWMFVTPSRWRKMAESSTTSMWRACGIGPFVLAFRIRFGLT
jgi:hypothetical protein